MKKNKKILVSASVGCILLTGCTYNTPQEIIGYLDPITLNRAKDWVKNVTLRYTITEKKVDSEEIVGTQESFFMGDFSNSLDLYSFKAEYYTGKYKIDVDGDEEQSLNDSYRMLRYLRDDKNYIYTAERMVDDQRIDDIAMTHNEMSGRLNNFFVSNSAEALASGGLYYGDRMKSSLKYNRFMSIEDGLFVYYVDKEGTLDKDGNLATVITQRFTMNEYGMLLTHHQEIQNLVENTIAITDLNIDYNLDSFTRIMDINIPKDSLFNK